MTLTGNTNMESDLVNLTPRSHRLEPRACYGLFIKNLEPVRQHLHIVSSRARSSMDRAPDYGSGGWGFKSLRAHQRINNLHILFSLPLLAG
jgi:hypothetical protein